MYTRVAGVPASRGEGERSSVDGKAVGKVRQSDRVGWLVARASDAPASGREGLWSSVDGRVGKGHVCMCLRVTGI